MRPCGYQEKRSPANWLGLLRVQRARRPCGHQEKRSPANWLGLLRVQRARRPCGHQEKRSPANWLGSLRVQRAKRPRRRREKHSPELSKVLLCYDFKKIHSFGFYFNLTPLLGIRMGKALRKAKDREEWRKVAARSSLMPQRSFRLRDE